MPSNYEEDGTATADITFTSDKPFMLSFDCAGSISNTSVFTAKIDGKQIVQYNSAHPPLKATKYNVTIGTGRHTLQLYFKSKTFYGIYKELVCVYNIKAVSSFSGPGAVYDPSTSTLTLKECVSEPISENLFAVSDGMVLSEKIDKNITKVVIDESFKAFAPTTLNSFFKGLRSLETVQGFGNLNTENVTNMAHMFYDCNGLVNLDIEKLNTENVVSMTGMFYGCKKLKSLDLSGFRTEKVTGMGNMFEDCRELEELNLSSFNTGLVETMWYMFSGATKLTAIYVSELFSTASVKNSGRMFDYCYKLPNFSDVTDATRAHYGDGGYFTYLPPYVTACVVYDTKSKTLFLRKLGATGENEQVVANLYNQSGNANWFDGKSSQWGLSNSMYEKFGDSESPVSVVIDPSFKTYAVPTCYGMFAALNSLETISGLENLDTSAATSMAHMFSGSGALKSLDLSGFDTSNVTTMEYMFYCCEGLTSVDVSGFNTAKVTTMYDMFGYCNNLLSLDLSSFDTGALTDAERMFEYCESIKTIYVSDKFVVTQLDPLVHWAMFQWTRNLKGAVAFIAGYDNVGVEYANYKTGYLTKLVAKNGGEKIGAVGETLTATGNVALNDDKDFEAYDNFKTGRVTYSRTMSAGTTWASLCLPFYVSLQGQNFRAFKIVSIGGNKVELEELQGGITEKTPVIIKMNSGQTKLNFSLKNKWIAAGAPTTVATASGNHRLVGLFAKKMFDGHTGAYCYIVKDNKLMNPAMILAGTSTTSVGLKAFRAYLESNVASTAGAKSLSFDDDGDGEATGFDQLFDTLNDSAATYYDLQGHRLDGPQKGVNIVKRGGKTMKVVIR